MITLDQAQAIIAGKLANATSSSLKPLSVIVLDAGGHLLAAVQQDGASFGRITIAQANAHGTLAMANDTAAIAGITAAGFTAGAGAGA